MEMKNWANLTDEQEVKIRPIVEEQVKKRDELIRKYEKKGREAMISLENDLRDLRLTAENRLQYFLTNKQMIEYGNMQREEDERVIRGKTQEKREPEKPRERGPR